jgi:hypothetical protein
VLFPEIFFYVEIKGKIQDVCIKCKCKMYGRSSVKLDAFRNSTLDTLTPFALLTGLPLLIASICGMVI